MKGKKQAEIEAETDRDKQQSKKMKRMIEVIKRVCKTLNQWVFFKKKKSHISTWVGVVSLVMMDSS